MHLRQNLLYSGNVNKNPVQSFVLLHLKVSLIYQYHYMPKKKYTKQKKQKFDDATFAMT